MYINTKEKKKKKERARKLGWGALTTVPSRPTQSQSEDGKQNADTANAKGGGVKL
jgi:hypothetical protein